MSEIIVSMSCIKIENFKESTTYTKFLNKLSVWNNSKYRGKYVSWQAYIIRDDDLFIHKGIELNLVKRFFPNHKLVYDDVPSPYKFIKEIKMTVKPRNEIQEQSIDFLCNNDDESQLMLCLQPGTGKTYCAINYVVKKQLIPIIIVDSSKLISQWKESFLKFTNINEDEIFTISGSKTIEKLMKMKNNPYKIYLASHRTLQSYSSEDWTLINDLLTKLGVGIKIFDEAHVEWKNIFYIDTMTETKQTIYLTATPDRSNPSEQEVYSRMFGDILMFGYEESRDKQYIRYIEYEWNSHPTMEQELNMSNSHGFDSNAYNDYLINERYEKFTDILISLIKMFLEKYPDKKIAVVVNCINAIEELCTLFSIQFENSIGTFCGLVPKNKREKELDNQIILTTVKGFNKGVDVENLATVINTVSINSQVLIEQLVGRLRYNENYKSYFVQLTDNGFKQCKIHSKNRNNIMNNIADKFITIKD